MSRGETSGRRPAVSPALARLKQYQGYIKRVTAGEPGRLTPGRGETPAAVRRRLGAAAKFVALPRYDPDRRRLLDFVELLEF